MRAVRGAPDGGWFTTLLGEAWLAHGDVERARALAADGLHVTEAIGYRYGVGWAQRALGRIAVAIRLFETLRLPRRLDRARELGATLST